MRIYLDACCLNRLADDQSQARIQAESAAIEQLLDYVRNGLIELVSSETLESEIRRNPSSERRVENQSLLALATEVVELNDEISQRAEQLRDAMYGVYDALHLASAEAAAVDVFLATDDRLLRKALRGDGRPRIVVRNPISWIQERGYDGSRSIN